MTTWFHYPSFKQSTFCQLFDLLHFLLLKNCWWLKLRLHLILRLIIRCPNRTVNLIIEKWCTFWVVQFRLIKFNIILKVWQIKILLKFNFINFFRDSRISYTLFKAFLYRTTFIQSTFHYNVSFFNYKGFLIIFHIFVVTSLYLFFEQMNHFVKSN